MKASFPLRYLGWMTRDAALRAGMTGLVIAVLFTFLYSRLPTGAVMTAPREFLIRTVGQFAWLVTLIGTAGMVSWDRASGYYRSLFSQPVNPGLYYLQRWLITAVAVAAFLPLLSLGVGMISGVFPWSGPVLARLLLEYLLLGGLTLLLSTLLRVDWLIAFLLSVLQGVLYQLDHSGVQLNAFTRLLLNVLPPFHTASIGFGAVQYPTGSELAHAVLYGAGLVLLAVIILFTRPLGSGGRA